MAPDLLVRPAAEDDLAAIYDYIAEDSPTNAKVFIEGIRKRCSILLEFPEIGRSRPDLQPGLRLFGFERRIVVAYRVSEVGIEIIRIFSRGRDVDALLSGSGAP